MSGVSNNSLYKKLKHSFEYLQATQMNKVNPVNPRAAKFERVENHKKEYPIKVICIVDEYSDGKSPLIQEVRSHAHNSNVSYSTRIFDSRKYEEDRDYITRLPAFHIYIKGIHHKTFFTSNRPLQHIDESIEVYLKRKEERDRRREAWKCLYRDIGQWIGFIGLQKSADKKESLSKSQPSINTVKHKVSDWN